MKLALEALGWTDEWRPDGLKEQAITALREALTSVPDWASEAKEQPRAEGTLAQQSAERGEPVQNNPLDCNVYLGSGKDHAIKYQVSYGPAQETDQSVMYTYLSKPEPIPCGKPIGILMKRKGYEHMKLYPLAEQPAPVAKLHEQEPVAIHQFRSPHCSDWYDGVPDHHDGHGPYEVRTLYASPPAQRKPLTDEEVEAMWPLRPTDSIIQFARAIEAAHGIKENT